MIIYATAKTRERFGLGDIFEDPNADEQLLAAATADRENELQQWGAKLFYFERRKCLLLCNVATKFSVALADLRKSEIDDIGDQLATITMNLYRNDPEMLQALTRMFGESPRPTFAKLTEKRTISQLNQIEGGYLSSGRMFWKHIDDEGVLHLVDVAHQLNFELFVSDKKRYECGGYGLYRAGERFRDEVLAAYGPKASGEPVASRPWLKLGAGQGEG